LYGSKPWSGKPRCIDPFDGIIEQVDVASSFPVNALSGVWLCMQPASLEEAWKSEARAAFQGV